MATDKFLFLGANTADGFVGFYDILADTHDLKKLYILKGGSGIGKSTFIRKFADAFKAHDREFLVCSGDPKSLDGVIIPALGLGTIDGTAPHIVDPIYPGVIDEIVNLGEFIDSRKVTADKEALKSLKNQKAEHYKQAYAHLATAREVHSQIESHYKDAVDFKAIDKRLAQIISKHI